MQQARRLTAAVAVLATLALAVPGDDANATATTRTFEYSSGAQCLTANATPQVHAIYGSELSVTPIGCTTTRAVLDALRGQVSHNHTTQCNEPAPVADEAALARYAVPFSVLMQFTIDPSSTTSRNAACAVICQGSAGFGPGVIALWNGGCLCFNDSLARTPPHAASVACCGLSPSDGVRELEAAASRGVITTGANLFLSAVGNSCLDVEAGSCRDEGLCGARTMPNSTSGEAGATCCAVLDPPPSAWTTQEIVGVVIVCAVAAVAIVICVARYACRAHDARVAREEQEREEAALGTIVPMDEVASGGDRRRLRDEGEAASLSAAFMFGMRRTTVPELECASAAGSAVDDCVVCLNHFHPGTSVSVLPCGHLLHSQCLMDFVTFHLRRYSDLLCPTCRQPLLGGGPAPQRAAERHPEPSPRHSNRPRGDGDGAAVAAPAPPRSERSPVTPPSDDDEDDAPRMPVNPIAASAAGAPVRPRQAEDQQPLLVLPRYDGSRPQ